VVNVSRANGLRHNDVCRAEREVVGRLFNKGRATGPSGKKCFKYRGKWVGRRSLTGGPLITDKFRQAANDGFRQMTILGVESGDSNGYRRALSDQRRGSVERVFGA